MNTFWRWCAAFLIIGYISMGRAFSYIGVPSAHLFIGEIFLVAFLCFQSRAVFDRWYRGLAGQDNFGALSWSLLIFVFYGVIEVAHGFVLGYPPLTIIENLVFHAYPLYLFIGMYLASIDPGFLKRTIVGLAWFNCFYGIAFVFVLTRLTVTMPGSDVPVFSGAGGGSLVILGLLTFETRLAKSLLPMLSNAFLMLALQVRAEWLGFGLGLCAWGLLSRRMSRVGMGFAMVAVLLAAGYAFDFSIPSPTGRGGNVSFEDIVGRAVASVDSDKAREFSRSADQFAGTVSWRKNWWNAIWDSVHADSTTTLIGHGYGYPLGELVPYLKNAEIRTPHNVFFYALAYGGWIGVIIFFGFQASLGLSLWNTYRLTGQPFGIVLWLMALSSSFLGNLFETPFGAIPLYMLIGAALTPGHREEAKVIHEDSHRAQLIPAARW